MNRGNVWITLNLISILFSYRIELLQVPIQVTSSIFHNDYVLSLSLGGTMSTTVRRINEWFRTATRADVNDLLEKIVLSDRQTRIFEMFYIKRRYKYFFTLIIIRLSEFLTIK